MNITYLHGEPTPRKELEPFDVVQGSFHAQLYDINSLLDLPAGCFLLGQGFIFHRGRS